METHADCLAEPGKLPYRRPRSSDPQSANLRTVPGDMASSLLLPSPRPIADRGSRASAIAAERSSSFPSPEFAWLGPNQGLSDHCPLQLVRESMEQSTVPRQLHPTAFGFEFRPRWFVVVSLQSGPPRASRPACTRRARQRRSRRLRRRRRDVRSRFRGRVAQGHEPRSVRPRLTAVSGR